MASTALSDVWGPSTLTDSRNDITTVKSQSVPVGLTPADIVTSTPGMIELLVESGNESRRVRFKVPSWPGPQWLVPSILRAGKLLLLPYDWNRQGAPPVDSMAIQIAIDTLSSLMSPSSSLPQFTPTERSGVQLDWHENGVDLEIAFDPGEIEGLAVFNDQARPELEWDGPVGKHLQELRTLLRERLAS